MRRYRFLSKSGIFNALNKLRTSFLAAKDGTEVDKIINGILTSDERMKVGRRIMVAQMLLDGMKYREIRNELKVGLSTIEKVHTLLNKNPDCYHLINKREEKVEKVYKTKAYRSVGGSKMVFKSKEYTGFKRKQVRR